MLEVKIDGLEDALRWFDPKIVDNAAKRAINDAAKKARTAADAEIRKTWNLAKKNLKGKLQVTQKASLEDLAAIVEAKSRPISLSEFGVTATRGKVKQTRKGIQILKRASRQQGVSVQILKGKPKTRLPHAFLGKVGGGHQRVFERMTKSRLPLADRHVITVASMFEKTDVQSAVEDAIDDTFVRRFNHHLDRLLSGKGR